MREPDPPGGRGGAGARGAEARRPPASPIHSAEPGGRGARAASSARRERGRRARAAGALPSRRPPRAAPPASHHVRPRGQRAAGRDHFGLRRWVPGAPGARGRAGGTPRRGALPPRAPSPAPASPTWRTRSGARAPRRPPRCLPASFLLLYLPSGDSPLEGSRGSRGTGRGARLPRGRHRVPVPVGPRAPAALRRGEEPVTRLCVQPRARPPSPTPVLGPDRAEFRPERLLSGHGSGRRGLAGGAPWAPVQARGHPLPPPAVGRRGG